MTYNLNDNEILIFVKKIVKFSVTENTLEYIG